MFSRTDAPAQRLLAVMQEYDRRCDSDPVTLRMSIPENEVWRYWIDGVDQHEGFMPYETRENNYLTGMCKAFQRIYTLDQPLTIKLMRQLHLLAMSRVAETQYEKLFGDLPDDDEADKIGDFRQSENAIFGLVDDNASIAGIEEMLERNHPHLSLGLRIEGLDEEQFGYSFLRLNKQTFAEIKRYISMLNKARKLGARVTENPHPLLSLFETLDKRNLVKLFDANKNYNSKLRVLADIDGVSELAKMIYHLACQGNKVVFESLQAGNTNAVLKRAMKAMIGQYERDMQGLHLQWISCVVSLSLSSLVSNCIHSWMVIVVYFACCCLIIC